MELLAPVQSPRRGRPPAYDAAIALRACQALFWERGLDGASLDQISAATGMARPSLYAAFGDKRRLYLACLALYRKDCQALLERALRADGLRRRLAVLFAGALDLYWPQGSPARGCFAIKTAPLVVGDSGVQAAAQAVHQDLAEGLDRLWTEAMAAGEPVRQSAEILRDLTLGLLHALAVRSQIAHSRRTLMDLTERDLSLLLARASMPDAPIEPSPIAGVVASP